jgi:hypothetical protein
MSGLVRSPVLSSLRNLPQMPIARAVPSARLQQCHPVRLTAIMFITATMFICCAYAGIASEMPFVSQVQANP